MKIKLRDVETAQKLMKVVTPDETDPDILLCYIPFKLFGGTFEVTKYVCGGFEFIEYDEKWGDDYLWVVPPLFVDMIINE